MDGFCLYNNVVKHKSKSKRTNLKNDDVFLMKISKYFHSKVQKMTVIGRVVQFYFPENDMHDCNA